MERRTTATQRSTWSRYKSVLVVVRNSSTSSWSYMLVFVLVVAEATAAAAAAVVVQEEEEEWTTAIRRRPVLSGVVVVVSSSVVVMLRLLRAPCCVGCLRFPLIHWRISRLSSAVSCHVRRVVSFRRHGDCPYFPTSSSMAVALTGAHRQLRRRRKTTRIRTRMTTMIGLLFLFLLCRGRRCRRRDRRGV